MLAPVPASGAPALAALAFAGGLGLGAVLALLVWELLRPRRRRALRG